MTTKNDTFTPEEKKVIIEELEDVQDHYESLIEAQVFETDMEREEAIGKVATIDGILRKI